LRKSLKDDVGRIMGINILSREIRKAKDNFGSNTILIKILELISIKTHLKPNDLIR